MQKSYEGEKTGDPTFRFFLLTHWPKVLLILLLAFAVRVGFIVSHPHTGGDMRYVTTAGNIVSGNGFSMDSGEPYRPSEAAVPAYSLFIAAVYMTMGRCESCVQVLQAFMDLFTCLLIAFASFNLAPVAVRGWAALSSLAIYGVLSWPTMVWIPFLLTETLTLFLYALTVALCATAIRKGAWHWLGAGLTCGLAILTRPDSALLAIAVALFLLIRVVRERSRAGAADFLAFCFAVALALAPWVARNYVSLGKFQPLASEYGSAQEGYFPTGYLWWVRTWLGDETHFDYAFNPAWHPETTFFDPDRLPRDAYDSEEERRRVVSLIARFNQERSITPELDREFRRLAYDRMKQAPLRSFVLLPSYRAASMWLTGFSTSRETPYVLALRVLSVLPIHVGGIIGIVLLCRRRPLALLLTLIVIVRTTYLAYHYAPETRYMVEVYPPMIIACGTTAAAAWSYVRERGVNFVSAGRRRLLRDTQASSAGTD
jgi:4-amino-4-deoxy-L-arabinose transferase-like glycosyltransferase